MTVAQGSPSPAPDQVIAAAAAAASVGEHDTLKYHLLGPSLTKAGQDAVDQRKVGLPTAILCSHAYWGDAQVSETIYEASKGSKYFNNEEVKDKNLTKKIESILARKRKLESVDLQSDLRRADDYIAQLELSRDLSQTVVHIDCDAFYAAVEELDRPELKHVPMAVGKGVLTTCNYHARKFGCRSGMAGFIAMKLCPHLICLPLNFDKYTAKAQEVRAILANYDPRFESASIDEAYLNITKYLQEHDDLDPESAVQQLRAEVSEKTKITISAGIAANAKLAKIASNKNKPNGQYRVPSTRADIMAFMRELPTRKVNGIGRVFERELDAIGIKTCGDIYAQRAYLSKLFGEKAFSFLMNCYLGLGRTVIQPAEEYERKSVGTESTFGDISDKGQLRAKLRATAEELEKDLVRTGVRGRTLVLKMKMHTYEVLTRQVILPRAIAAADELYTYALPMLAKLERERPGMRIRLMGLRVTNLTDSKPGPIDFFGFTRTRQQREGGLEGEGSGKRKASVLAGASDCNDDGGGEWEVWPEEEFEAAARREKEDEMAEMSRLSQEEDDHLFQGPPPDQQQRDPDDANSTKRRRHGKEILPNPIPATAAAAAAAAALAAAAQKAPTSSTPAAATHPAQHDAARESEKDTANVWQCPICSRPQRADGRQFNAHIDYCLSRQTIRDAVKDAAAASASASASASAGSGSGEASGEASGTRADGGAGAETETKKTRAFFR
ncbi:MAG: hypothetical protein M1819_002994 [Sarea resinae]|nr:MAG: hypothetical protein M1819_002994 [Sarea resinae]